MALPYKKSLHYNDTVYNDIVYVQSSVVPSSTSNGEPFLLFFYRFLYNSSFPNQINSEQVVEKSTFSEEA